MQQVPVEKQNNQVLGTPDNDNSDQAFDGSFAPWEPQSNTEKDSQEKVIDTSAPAQMVYKPSLGGEEVPPEDSQNKLKYPRMGTFIDRFVALLIDLVILSILISAAYYFFYSILLPFFTKSEFFLSTSNNKNLIYHNDVEVPRFAIDQIIASQGLPYTVIVAIALSLAFIISYLYYGWFEVHMGQSPGKMVMRLKVVRSQDYTYVTWGQAFVRLFIGRLISKGVFYIGYIWYFMSKDRQTWHDLIARTYVVKVDKKGKIIMDGLEKYERKPLIFIALLIPSIIFVFAAVSGAAIFQRNQMKILDSVDAEVYSDFQSFHSALENYYEKRNSHPWENVTVGDMPSKSGTPGTPLVLWHRGQRSMQPWISGVPNSLILLGVLDKEFENSASAIKLKIWSDRKGHFLLCFKPEAKKTYIPMHSEYGVHVGEGAPGAVMYCEGGGL